MDTLKWFFILFTIIGPVKNTSFDPVQDQLLIYKSTIQGAPANMTTTTGTPIDYRDTSSLNSKLILNRYFMETITHVVREKIPERIVHGKGGGAFGYFEVTHDITKYIKSDFLNEIGKITPVAVRFSPAVVERGASDSARGPRGFAVKFYTKEGNFDIPGFNTPIFAFKDPILFASFAHAQRKNPATSVPDPNMLWDFITSYPESTNLFLRVWGEFGIPQGYRHMDGYGIHTYQVHNKHGDISFVRFKFIAEAGRANLTTAEGMKLDASDPDSFNRDLYEAIGCGKNASWIFGIQLVTQQQAKNAKIDVFDVTVDLPVEDYPFIPVGRMVLNKNPKNYFAEIEPLAFCPGNLVPGVDGGLDKMYEARALAYRDSQIYRLGANFHRFKVNCPFSTKSHIYYRDGQAPIGDNEEDSPNYYKNSFNGPIPYNDTVRPKLVDIVQEKSNNLDQVRDYYKKLSDHAKQQVVENIVGSVGQATQFIKDKAVAMFTNINSDLSKRVSKALKKIASQKKCQTRFP